MAGMGWTRFRRADTEGDVWVQWHDIVAVVSDDTSDGAMIAIRGAPAMVAVQETVETVMKVVQHPRERK